MAKAKPGTPHPTKRGMVMGTKGRYVAKSTYNKQVKAAKTETSRPKVKGRQVKTNPTGPARGAQGPARPPVQGPSRPTPRTMGGDTGRRGGVNKYGTAGTPKSGPPGIGKRPRFNPAIRTASKVARAAKGLGAAGLAISGLATAKDLADSLKRGEGLAKLAKKGTTQGKGTKGGQGGSRAAVKRKPQQPAKPKRTVTSRNRRGRPTSYAKPVKPAKRGMSNIPPKEGTGKGSPNDKKRQNVTPKAQSKPKVKAKPKTVQERAYAADSRNREYDRLRRAGKIKEAAVLGKKIAADAAAKRKKRR